MTSQLHQIAEHCKRFALRDTLAVYEPIDERRVKQIGSGILFRHRERHLFVTAAHALYGHGGDENPADKAIFLEGSGLRQIGDLRRGEIGRAKLIDLAAVEVDGLPAERGFPMSCLPLEVSKPAYVTICGYLARDFKRHAQTLSPQPFIHTAGAVAVEGDWVGIKYEKNRNRNTKTGARVMAPIPAGVSGGPMLDGEALLRSVVSIVAVFTDKPAEKGFAFGEASPKVRALLDAMIE